MLVRNVTLAASASLTVLLLLGLWAPPLPPRARALYSMYSAAVFMMLMGTFILIQAVELVRVWGDLQLMTATAFLLFTNLAQSAKVANLLLRKDRIQRIIEETDRVLREAEASRGVEREIVRSCNRETLRLFIFYVFLTNITVTGWAASAEKNQLPLLGWYPYNTSSHPQFELTYVHQVFALVLSANLNVTKDCLMATLMTQTRCRLRLLRQALASLHQGLEEGDMLTPEQERLVSRRLRDCVVNHQMALAAARELQGCFSEPTAAQFAVSMVIICVTAFQLVSISRNLIRLCSMTTYLANMVFQVFLYCHQGNSLREESMSVSAGAYACGWLRSRTPLRRSLLLVATRAQRPAAIHVGGFVGLTLPTFMAIIKASYSFFTVLQQVEETN